MGPLKCGLLTTSEQLDDGKHGSLALHLYRTMILRPVYGQTREPIMTQEAALCFEIRFPFHSIPKRIFLK